MIERIYRVFKTEQYNYRILREVRIFGHVVKRTVVMDWDLVNNGMLLFDAVLDHELDAFRAARYLNHMDTNPETVNIDQIIEWEKERELIKKNEDNET